MLFEPRGDGLHIGQRGLDGDSIAKARNGEEVVAAAALFAVIGVVQRCPHLGAAAWREVELGRQHADDGVGGIIERQGLS